MARPVWQGYLRLSLVTCPVALFHATTRVHDVSFHLLHKDTHNRINMIPRDPDLGEVSRQDLVKGYEIEKDNYVILTNEEIAAVRLESTRNIDIEQFVDIESIDRIYWNDPYYLAADGDIGRDAYTVIREAMAATGMVALGRLVMHTRERIVAIEARNNGLLLTTLRSADEVRDEKEFFDDGKVKIDKEMREIAEKIIAQKTEKFSPAKFTDRYENALRALIRQKMKGHKPVAAPPPDRGDNVIDLMAALRKSLKGSGSSEKRTARRSSSARASTARKRKRSAPARKAS